MRCKDCLHVRGYAYKRSHLVALPTPKDFRERPAIHVVAWRAMSAWACSGTSERQLLPKTDLHLRRGESFLQRPSYSLPAPSSLLVSCRKQVCVGALPQDSDEEQCCDWPMKPDFVQTGEDIN
jgi:hypothetical protein